MAERFAALAEAPGTVVHRPLAEARLVARPGGAVLACAACGAEEAVPWRVGGLPSSRAVFALELGGTPIDRFAFAPSGLVLVGSEELGLSPEALRLADGQLGRVSIPMVGAKRSLNVSVAFGILMHAWHGAITRGAT